MKSKLSGRILPVFVLIAGFLTAGFVRADQPEQVATVEQLKSEAFKALKEGQFDRTTQLIAKAATMDPSLTQISTWIKQFDKAVGDVHKILDGGKDSYAITFAARAYLLADDKEAFRKEPWIDALVQKTIKLAADADEHQQWLTALRLYSDLGSIEPANPEWKDKLKLATRRIRLLAVYAPDEIKTTQDKESKERDEVEALVKTQAEKDKDATTKPVTEPNESFKTDWHDTLKGIRLDMLKEALADARSNYWRDVNYRTLLLGGLKGVQAVVTTPGLEAAFPNLKDDNKRQEFQKTLDECIASANDQGVDNDAVLLSSSLSKLKSANTETVDLPEEVLVSEFADGAFAELDPFTSMIWPSDVEEFNKSTQGEFSGVGIQIQLEDAALKVVSPLEDSPAYKQGIKAGDIITAINGKNAKGITLNQAVKNITGVEGTYVTLTIRSPGGKVKEYRIRREKIKVASVKGWTHKPGGGWDYFIDPVQKVGYVRLTNFTKTSGAEMDQAVDEMKAQGAKAMILDLRYNPGGLLTAATDIADKFLKEGTIVSTKADRDTPVAPPIDAKDSKDDFELPMVVLVNQFSASASEIVSGALKDLHRATIVGERTFGKGSVQMLFPIDRDPSGRGKSYLKLTTSHYYLPSGRCIHREENSTAWGVDPDLTVEMTPEQMRAAIEARQDVEVLRDSAPAEGEQPKIEEKAEKAKEGANDVASESPTSAPVTADATAALKATTKPAKKDLLASDPQLGAGLLLLRLQLSGVSL
ncbi:MAG TPA: S41 family peptidase [Tepidisphaeraceae bacterium]|nr:S41 family peptidase [Tepidisphaeraceae bacterium]